MPNDHCTGQYYATPKWPMTSTHVTFGMSEKRAFSAAKEGGAIFLTQMLQQLCSCTLLHCWWKEIYKERCMWNCAVTASCCLHGFTLWYYYLQLCESCIDMVKHVMVHCVSMVRRPIVCSSCHRSSYSEYVWRLSWLSGTKCKFFISPSNCA